MLMADQFMINKSIKRINDRLISAFRSFEIRTEIYCCICLLVHIGLRFAFFCVFLDTECRKEPRKALVPIQRIQGQNSSQRRRMVLSIMNTALVRAHHFSLQTFVMVGQSV